MSRTALPDESIQEAAYQALKSLFESNSDSVIEIEILPSSIPHPDGNFYLQDEKSVGIPKKVLTMAFLAATRTFAIRKSGDSLNEALAATQVILLFDPEHLTAANFRKENLLALSKENQDAFKDAMSREMIFLDSILTSPLHRQSKSPTLWYHRFWIVSTFMLSARTEPGVQAPPDSSVATSLLLKEMLRVFKSAEQHQLNYYAFQYARRLWERASGVSEEHENVNLLKEMLNEASSWCIKHPSDTSGWSFLLFLMGQSSVDWRYLQCKNAVIVKHVLHFALDVGWKGEGLWNFLRTILRAWSLFLSDEESQLLEKIRTEMASLRPDLRVDGEQLSPESHGGS